MNERDDTINGQTPAAAAFACCWVQTGNEIKIMEPGHAGNHFRNINPSATPLAQRDAAEHFTFTHGPHATTVRCKACPIGWSYTTRTTVKHAKEAARAAAAHAVEFHNCTFKAMLK